MTEGSFAAWLLSQRLRNDPIGDLARDFGQDEDAPKENTELFSYLKWRLPQNLEELVDGAWVEWLTSRIQR